MKKFLAFATLASVALVGCVNDEKMEMTSQAKKISFDNPVMTTQTRADVKGEIYGTTYPADEEFVVYAVQHNGNLTTWNDAKSFWTSDKTTPITVTKEGNGWEEQNGKDYYWPKASDENVKLSFAAYSPAEFGSGTASYGATGLTIANFEVNDVVSNQIDLMYSERVLNQTETSDGGVNITFKHALSSIVFAAIDNHNAATYTIKSIEVNGDFLVKETFNEGVTDDDTYSSVPKWTAASTSQNKEYAIWDGEYVVTGEAKEFTGKKDANLPQTALLVIPQEDAPYNATVTITYTRDVTNGEDNTYTVTKALNLFKNAGNAITEWEIGKRYIYTFQFGGTKKIFFKPSVDGWEDQTAVSLEI